ncbi:MAG: hypothetical protein JNK11_05355 [Alphaproteobacteria bacterium]|nr:hypothetical protein [Alphaproteobacteria bacterium]
MSATEPDFLRPFIEAARTGRPVVLPRQAPVQPPEPQPHPAAAPLGEIPAEFLADFPDVSPRDAGTALPGELPPDLAFEPSNDDVAAAASVLPSTVNLAAHAVEPEPRRAAARPAPIAAPPPRPLAQQAARPAAAAPPRAPVREQAVPDRSGPSPSDAADEPPQLPSWWPQNFALSWGGLFRGFVFLALVFFIAATIEIYFSVVRPLAVNERLNDFRGKLEQQIGKMRDELAAAESQLAAARAGAAEAERRRAQAIEEAARPADRAADRAADRPGKPLSRDEAQRLRELERETARKDQEIAQLKRGIAELRTDSKRLATSPQPVEMALEERRKFVIEEFISKVAILANRNAIHLAFVRALSDAAKAYDAQTLPFPDTFVRDQFLRSYPKLRSIQLFQTGREIIEAQLGSVEFEMLEPQTRQRMQDRVRAFLIAPNSLSSPLVMEVAAGITAPEFNDEVKRLETSFRNLFGDLERLRQALLSGG